MDLPLYVLREEPFEGYMPQDLFQWLKNDVTNEQLAEACAIVNSHCGSLMIFSTEDDPWGDQAYYDWRDVEDEIISMIIDRSRRLGLPLPEKTGTHHLIKPFMNQQGYKEYGIGWRKEIK